MTHAVDIEEDEIRAFTVDDLPSANEARSARISGTDYLTLATEKFPELRPPSYVRGVSLSAVLQLLHLERKTCVLEVIGETDCGKLTLVNGELADAEADGLRGEEAVYRVLTWHRPRTTIIDGVSVFRHSVTLPIPHLLLEAARRQDEGIFVPHPPEAVDLGGDELGPSLGGDEWHRLTESLIVNGALLAAVVRAADASLLAIADEYGRLSVDAAQAQADELSPLIRTIRIWPEAVDPAVDEVIVVIGRRQYLVGPVDSARTLFVCVALGSTESLDLARQTIRHAIR